MSSLGPPSSVQIVTTWCDQHHAFVSRGLDTGACRKSVMMAVEKAIVVIMVMMRVVMAVVVTMMTMVQVMVIIHD